MRLNNELNFIRIKVVSTFAISLIIASLNNILFQIAILFTSTTLSIMLIIRSRSYVGREYVRSILYFIIVYLITSSISQLLVIGKLDLKYTFINAIKFINIFLISLLIISTIKIKRYMLKDPVTRLIFYVIISLHLINEALKIFKEIKYIVKVNYGLKGIRYYIKGLRVQLKVLTYNVLMEVLEYYEVSMLKVLEGIKEHYYTLSSVNS